VARIPFAIAIAAAAFSITSAGAADLGGFPPQSRFYPPTPMLRVYNWTGCYLGGQLGGAFADNHVNGLLTTNGASGASITTAIDQNASSTAAIIGGQVGCDLQFARNWVIGAQIDGAWTHLNGSQAFTSSGSGGLPLQGSISLSANTIIQANVLSTATGRIGYAANFADIAGLFYLKGGAAFVNYDAFNIKGQTSTITCAAPELDPQTGLPTGACAKFNNPVNIAVASIAPSASQWGWTIGLGTEWMIGGNWSIFGEWDYLNFGTHNLTFNDVNSGSSQLSVKQSINELKLGINYRFGGPLPQQYP
jgi:outer membrane immunogenic protein